MPQYQWTGVTLTGNIIHGQQYALSPAVLEQALFKQEIAVITIRTRHAWLTRSWNGESSISFFKHLHALTAAGIFLAESLRILVHQARAHERGIIEAIQTQVLAGASLSAALASLPYFSPVMITLVRVGEETGTLTHALDALVHHVEFKQRLYQRLRTAALIPGITFLFFIGVVLALLLFVIPRFASLCAGMNQVPPSTATLLAMSSVLTSHWGVVIVGCMVGCGVMIKRIMSSSWFDAAVLKIPLLNTIVIESAQLYFLEALTLLVRAGIPLPQALSLAVQAINNNALRASVAGVVSEVEAGRSLGTACEQYPHLFSPNLIAMIHIGEASGALGNMLNHCARQSETRLCQRLDMVASVVQPGLMIILGLLIAGLLLAVYVPIFELSSSVRLTP